MEEPGKAVAAARLGEADILRLKRWNTPTVYNGWEQSTKHDRLQGLWNHDETRDFMPQMGPMCGRAVTLRIETIDRDNPPAIKGVWDEYYRYVASIPGPKIVVMEDLSRPVALGSLWGEVTANTHRALGCVGAIVDGAIRDVDEMTNAGFKALARRLCVGHLFARPVAWNIDVRVFGVDISPGFLIHADKHGFMAIHPDDEEGLPEAVAFMDALECETVIPAVRFASGESYETILARRKASSAAFGARALERFRRAGEH